MVAEVEEQERNAENGGAKEGEAEHAGEDAVDFAKLASFNILYVGVEADEVVAAIGTEDDGVEDGLEDLKVLRLNNVGAGEGDIVGIVGLFVDIDDGSDGGAFEVGVEETVV